MSARTTALCVLLCLATGAWTQSRQTGSAVLALYKSSEGQTASDNEIVYHLEPELRGLGLTVRYHDLDRGLPGAATLQGVRAVVSWFRGPALADPLAYLEFIRTMVDTGRRYLILDNLGAYQDRATGRWLESGELNLTLSRFGIQYWGDWTDDRTLVVLRDVDETVASPTVLGMAGPRLYYRFIASDRDLDVHLSVERTDRKDGPSPVVVTNRNGGFALSTYLYRDGTAGTVLALDLGELARRAIFGRPREDRVAVIADPGDRAAALAARLALWAGIGADLREDPASLIEGELDPYTVVVLSLGGAATLPAGVLEDYLERGGCVVALSDALPPGLRAIVAVPEEATAAEVKGFRFASGFLPSEGVFLEDRAVPWTSGSLRPLDGSTVLGSDWAEEHPLLWSRRTDAGGTVLVWNAHSFFREEHAGLLLESILAARDVSAAMVPALGAIRLDGFPRPLYNTPLGSGRSTDTELYTQRVWPELHDTLDRRGIPVNATLLFNYNDRTEPPFLGGEVYMAQGQATVELARDLLEGSGELGLFGYNHVSLAATLLPPNVRVWPGPEQMSGALSVVRAEWSLLFGPRTVPRVYAAPYGILTESGLQALARVFPETRVAGTLVSAGQLSERGFGVDRTTGIRIVPASSYGFLFTEEARRLAMSAVAGEGIWVHAIDMDDAIGGPATAGKSWDELKTELDRMLAYMARHYPWLTYVRLSELDAALDLRDTLPARLERSGTIGGVTTYVIECAPGQTARLRYPGLKIASVRGAEVVYTYTRSDNAVLRATSGKITIALTRKS